MADVKNADAKHVPFKLEEMTRNKTVGWDPKANKGKGGAVGTSDLMDDDGKTVNVEKCKAFGVNPDTVRFITVADLPPDYAKGPDHALRALAKEWTTKDVVWTMQDVVYFLVLQSRLQDAANESLKAHRPVSDKAKDRASSTIIRELRKQGKSIDEVRAMLSAMSMPASEDTLKAVFGG